ncbi:sarcosine oxidase subunit gamma family protein [Marinomonas algarum]|uniref:Sarcosine oxidase subunit gamma n=1 Tax=Marinomonas algarum TaxID=2883105 RepID=A0A9X1LBE3_9GAMM|nr:sarcosine oxidase subunit gamma family protein [Marinomonas algarum]MCB5160739.1 sarcosine oxidase subunit gamma [Marinomonas algarum]
MDLFNLSAAPDLRKSMLDLASTKAKATRSSIKMQDCTVFSRAGFRGTGAEAFLASHGIAIPTKPNESLSCQASLVVLRLSRSEFWIISTDNSEHAKIEALEVAAMGVENVYPLYCQHSHACFMLTGAETENMFSKVCGVDLRNNVFPVGAVAQTSVARTGAIVTKQTHAQGDYFLLFADIASVQYLWEALTDAAAEFV